MYFSQMNEPAEAKLVLLKKRAKFRVKQSKLGDEEEARAIRLIDSAVTEDWLNHILAILNRPKPAQNTSSIAELALT